jgi:hypothetical protein
LFHTTYIENYISRRDNQFSRRRIQISAFSIEMASSIVAEVHLSWEIIKTPYL